MKKRVIMIFFLTLLLMCNGCSGKKEEKEARGIDYFTMPAPIETKAEKTEIADDADETISEEATIVETTIEEEEVLVGDGKGKVKDNSYINEGFGLEFVLPSGFEFISEEEMSSTGNTYEMWITSSNRSNMHIQNQHLPSEINLFEMMEKDLDDWIQSLEDAYYGATVDVKNVGKVTFANNKANLLEVDVSGGVLNIRQELYMIHKGDRVLIITITVPKTNIEEMDIIKDGFKSSK